ncbi:hypothetical protein AYO20_09381 [Fonsecaea nubica]|uniref:Isochorismatase-like domain-containing protein n=1 Tax=Fonsecaea nubica TaxID=856822 RepID=A0A178CGL9_9EURO|nr:hypothetical protein AYO20_09381 [Fonsecaea nubica]OAL28657.1 hypothetical protein AYO20_09381 [Fonsecaea nubica]
MTTPTALLVCDVQNGIVERIPLEARAPFLQRLADTIAAARNAGVTIIYVRVAFRAGLPEISPRNASFARVKAHAQALAQAQGGAGGGGFGESEPSTQIHAAVAPREGGGDIVVTKRRVSALYGTDLDVILRSMDIGTLVIAGISTSGVVMSTVRQGADMDYKLVVLGDLCLDMDAEIHDAALKVIAKQAEVVGSVEWAKKL